MAGIQIDGVNNKIDFDDDLDTSISANVDDTLQVEVGGASVATLTASTIVFNEASADIDFRVEGNGNTHALFVDGGNDVVGINTADPSASWSGANNLVVSDTSSDGGIAIISGTSGNGNIMFADAQAGAFSDARGLITYLHNGDSMRFITANSEAMRIHSSGKVTIGSSTEVKTLAVQQDGGSAAMGIDIHNLGTNAADDALITFETQGHRNYSIGIDRSASSFVIARSDGFGTPYVTIADGGSTTITVEDNSDTLTLVSTDADENKGPVLNLYRNSGTPQPNDVIGKINITGRNDNSEDITYQQYENLIADETDGTEDGYQIFLQMKAGTLTERYRIETGTFVINEPGLDFDFRIEGDNEANLFFVDASTDRIGVGTSTPDNDIDLKKASNAIMKIESTNNGDDAKLLIKKAGSSSRNMIGFQSGNTWHVGHLRNSTTTFSIATQDDSGSSNEFRVSTSGVLIQGSITKGSGSFNIEHPHPDKKDTHRLVHSFVEAPQADNIYRGKVDLVGGSATVNVDTVSDMTDGTFVLLNTNIQCFTSNETGWTAVKGSVSGNTLTITAEDNSCTDTISWMVVGERHDQHMKDTNWTDDDGKVIVEPLKEVE
tara:strand:+ start:51 stop:1868 length:1818 start_codon:yes stop_codon:yes gene_type:complete